MSEPAATVERESGAGAFVLLCDHASNRIPDRYDSLGIDPATRESHAAWDPGALPVARLLAEGLDAPLVFSTVSRLVVDCNRVENAPDLFPTMTEVHEIPGNRNLDFDARMERLLSIHAAYHTLIEEVLEDRPDAALVAIHSFTPVWRGQQRPWDIGILHDDNRALADAMLTRLEARGDLNVGRNQPYSPADGVYYTLDRHGTSAGRAAAMVEIRNDLIETPDQHRRWADILTDALTGETA